MASIEPQNMRNHVHMTFSPLPQSETEAKYNEDKRLSISVESTGTKPAISNYHSDKDIVMEQISYMFQMALALTVMAMMIYFLLYIILSVFIPLGPPKEDPIPPIYILNSMCISNFTVGTTGLAATWNAKITVINNNVSSIDFDSVSFTIFYKKNPKDALSVAYSYGFWLNQGESFTFHLKFRTLGTCGYCEDDEPCVKNQLVEEIGKDRAKDGSLSFGMQMKVNARYDEKTWLPFNTNVLMIPHCEDLMVQFLHNKDSGRVVNPNRNFSVPIKWNPDKKLLLL